jgi:enoyl-CoA hydratase/carnithine racemase
MNGEDFEPEHFKWTVDGNVGTVTLDRPDRKNPLTFDSYGELTEAFYGFGDFEDIDAVVIQGSGGNFSSGGDVHEIIGPLTEMEMPELLEFTRQTGELIKSIRACPMPVIAAIDGVCMGAGAAIAMACDLRFGTPDSRVAFLFVKVGLAGCDMGACAMLPRIVGHGRASELLYTGRALEGQQAHDWGFYNRLVDPDAVYDKAHDFAEKLADGPNFAHAMTKKMLDQEWDMGIEEAIESEAQAQAICMQTEDFRRAYEAFVAGEKPDFQGD